MRSKSAGAEPSIGKQIRKKLLDTAKVYFGVEGHIKDGYDVFTGWMKVGSLYVQQHSIGPSAARGGRGMSTAAPRVAWVHRSRSVRNVIEYLRADTAGMLCSYSRRATPVIR